MSCGTSSHAHGQGIRCATRSRTSYAVWLSCFYAVLMALPINLLATTVVVDAHRIEIAKGVRMTPAPAFPPDSTSMSQCNGIRVVVRVKPPSLALAVGLTLSQSSSNPFRSVVPKNWLLTRDATPAGDGFIAFRAEQTFGPLVRYLGSKKAAWQITNSIADNVTVNITWQRGVINADESSFTAQIYLNLSTPTVFAPRGLLATSTFAEALQICRDEPGGESSLAYLTTLDEDTLVRDFVALRAITPYVTGLQKAAGNIAYCWMTDPEMAPGTCDLTSPYAAINANRECLRPSPPLSCDFFRTNELSDDGRTYAFRFEANTLNDRVISDMTYSPLCVSRQKLTSSLVSDQYQWSHSGSLSGSFTTSLSTSFSAGSPTSSLASLTSSRTTAWTRTATSRWPITATDSSTWSLSVRDATKSVSRPSATFTSDVSRTKSKTIPTPSFTDPTTSSSDSPSLTPTRATATFNVVTRTATVSWSPPESPTKSATTSPSRTASPSRSAGTMSPSATMGATLSRELPTEGVDLVNATVTAPADDAILWSEPLLLRSVSGDGFAVTAPPGQRCVSEAAPPLPFNVSGATQVEGRVLEELLLKARVTVDRRDRAMIRLPLDGLSRIHLFGDYWNVSAASNLLLAMQTATKAIVPFRLSAACFSTLRVAASLMLGGKPLAVNTSLYITVIPPRRPLSDEEKAAALSNLVTSSTVAIATVLTGGTLASQAARASFALSMFDCQLSDDPWAAYANPLGLEVGTGIARHATGAAVGNAILIAVFFTVFALATLLLSTYRDVAFSTASPSTVFPSILAVPLMVLMEPLAQGAVTAVVHGDTTQRMLGLGASIVCFIVVPGLLLRRLLLGFGA